MWLRANPEVEVVAVNDPFMDLEYIRMINVITCTSHLLSACLWFRQQCTGNLETREQISIVMMIRFYGNDPLVTLYFECEERDWGWTEERPERPSDPHLLLSFGTHGARIIIT